MTRLTEEQKTAIRDLRATGLGYKAIAAKMSLSRETVRSYCTRNHIPVEPAQHEQPCGCREYIFPKGHLPIINSAIAAIREWRIVRFCCQGGDGCHSGDAKQSNDHAMKVKIGNSVFVIRTSHSARATETAMQKIEKLILHAAAREFGNYRFAG